MATSIRGDFGIQECEAFAALVSHPAHHLYVCPPAGAEFRRHLAYRDFLRTHPLDAKAYGDQKLALADRFREDRPGYMAAKDGFVTALLSRAMAAQRTGSEDYGFNRPSH